MMWFLSDMQYIVLNIVIFLNRLFIVIVAAWYNVGGNYILIFSYWLFWLIISKDCDFVYIHVDIS